MRLNDALKGRPHEGRPHEGRPPKGPTSAATALSKRHLELVRAACA